MYPLEASFQPTIKERKFFLTKRVYMGLAPMGAQERDLICVLFGCKVSLIMRPVGDHYLIVGDTYIYGMMNREVIQDVEEGKLHYEAF
jgi:hypothetical protein